MGCGLSAYANMRCLYATKTTRLADTIISTYSAQVYAASDLRDGPSNNGMSVVSNPSALDGIGGVKALVSKPVYCVNGDKVVIRTFGHSGGEDQSLSYSSINSLGEVSSRLLDPHEIPDPLSLKRRRSAGFDVESVAAAEHFGMD